MITLNDSEFHEISLYIKKNYGVNLEKKRSLIEGRLGFYIYSKGFENFKDYFDYATHEPSQQELVNMINRLTTNHTYFMREEDHFEYYERHVLPWIENDLKTNDLRVWSAGCSSGQEPYTIVMATLHYLGEKAKNWDTTVLATDISDKALSEAKNGLYPASEVDALPQAWLDKYFNKVDDSHYQIGGILKKNVAYRNFNLLSPFNFKKPFQAIFCRNVMIYFDNDTKEKIVKEIYDSLLPGGYLFLGHSESLSTIKNQFTYLNPSIYQKVE